MWSEGPILHITDGGSVAGTLRESGIPGDVAIYGDLLYEGPAPRGLDAEAWQEIRARFIADAGYSTLEGARQYLKACDESLAAFPQHEEVVLWLDYRLSDQLILLKALDWFSRQNLGNAKLSLICIASYPGLDRFIGLGQLTADQLALLSDTWRPVTDDQFRLAQVAWNAFTSPDPTDIERQIGSDTSALPFIAAALTRHLEQFPSVHSGLSRTERQALSMPNEHDSVPWRRLFTAVQRLEEQVFMGDSSFRRMMRELSSARHPLVQVNDSELTLTEAGRDVIERRADHIDLNGIDRWLGGVHLYGDAAAWRWDRACGRLSGERGG